jgi:hypothetical protein
VVRAVDLDDQARRGSEEVDDVTLQHDLPPKPNPELRPPKRAPEHALGLRRSAAHAVCVAREPLLFVKL